LNPIILYDNILEDGTLTATDTATGDYDVDNLLDWRDYTWHQFAASGTKYYTLDAGAGLTLTADTLGIKGHNLYTATATITLQYSNDNFAADVHDAIPDFTVTTNYAILKTFVSVASRYWRIKIVTGAVAAKCAVICLGARITFPANVTKKDPLYNTGMSAASVRAKKGALLGSVVYYKPYEITYNIAPASNDYTWYSTTYKTFFDAHGSLLKPFFFAVDLTEFAANVLFCKLQDTATYNLAVKIYDHTDGFVLDLEGVAEA
jgi:hypothetical protein